MRCYLSTVMSRLALSKLLGLFPLLLLLPAGCTPGSTPSGSPLAAPGVASSPEVRRTPLGNPLVRVRLLDNQSSLRVSASVDPSFSTPGQPARQIAMAGRTIVFTRNAQGWNLGGVAVPAGATAADGTLTLLPAGDGTVTVNNATYRGTFRLVPTKAPASAAGPGLTFDVINDVDVDAYLKSVVSRELYKGWHAEAYRTQAVAARTYALYEVATTKADQTFDVFDDERSQVYGGLASETALSQTAVDSTRGIVLAFGPAGREQIFKTYFSSCCGGIGQSARDAFLYDPPYPPLAEKNAGGLCQDSPRYRWGPTTLAKTEITRRIRLYGQRRNRPEAQIGTVTRIAASHQNRLGRPVRYIVTDNRGTQYSMASEELRNALNTGAPGRTAFSGWITFVDNGPTISLSGRGSGHGVGMCQYCVQALALQGYKHESILRWSYPGAVLVRAY